MKETGRLGAKTHLSAPLAGEDVVRVDGAIDIFLHGGNDDRSRASVGQSNALPEWGREGGRPKGRGGRGHEKENKHLWHERRDMKYNGMEKKRGS